MLKRTLLLLVVVLVCSSSARAQIPRPPNSGYTIISPQGGNVATLTAVATLFSATEIGVARADVPPAPILTNAALSVSIGGVTESSTGLVFVNPSVNAATVNLVLTNALGVEISNRTISIPGGGQISVFVNTLFQLDFTAVSTGQLRITSNIPVAVQALDFRGAGFTSVPITNLAAGTLVSGGALTLVSIGVAPATLGVAPAILGVCPAIIGVAPATPGAAPAIIGVAPGVTRPLTTSSVTPPLTTAQLQPQVLVGGGAFIFPQVVTGGGAAANITIGNTARATQFVRLDFFSSSGELIRTIANISIPPRGFIVFSSESGDIIPPLN